MTFARLLSEAIASDGLPRTGDVLAVALPLLGEIAELHEAGLTTGLTSPEQVHYDGEGLHLVDRVGQDPARNETALRELNPAAGALGIEVRSRHRVDTVLGQSADWKSGDVHGQNGLALRPMLLVGYRAWEQDHGHHDALTDLMVAGLLITSFATGLDFDNESDVHTLASGRRQLTRLNPGLHPVVANVLGEMIDPDRHYRPPEVAQVITRLTHHRELPDDLDLSLAYVDRTDWRPGVLAALRDRVFDTTRRNRALYFRPSAATVSLTEASVPLLLDITRVKPDDLFTWTSSVADKLRSGSAVDLEQWCRFEEAPHVAPALDKLISNERKLRADSGHGRLRLILAFLRWFDPQNGDVVHSPLLQMQVELTRRKGVKKRYQLRIDGDAVVNPILRFVFKDRFDITLPEMIDPGVESIRAFVTDLERQVKTTAPAVDIATIEKPRVELLRRRAQLRVDNYRRRRAKTQASTGRWRRTPHSYSDDDWRPLGLALYQRFVISPDLPLRSLAGAPLRPRTIAPSFTDTALTGGGVSRTAQTYSVTQADVHQHRWEVDLCAVTLSMLGSRRTSLSRDYDDLLRRLDDGQRFDGSPFAQLFSPEITSERAPPVEPISLDQQLVLPADDAQARAVRRAVRGDSFIIQGPPGTGKSQTITNVIAALVAQGKRVLFVCEKRAALDVVDNRLRQVGLGDLVATIHDSQLDRKSFVMDLGATYKAWIEAGPSTELSSRSRLLGEMSERLRPLDFLVQDLSRPRLASLSVAGLIERSVLMRAHGIVPAPAPAHPVDLHRWFASRPALDATRDGLRASGLAPTLGSHAALRLQPQLAAHPDPVSTAVTLGRQLTEWVTALRSLWPATAPVDDVATTYLAGLLSFIPTIAAVAASPGGASLNPSAPQHQDLRRGCEDLTGWEQTVAASAVPARWKQPLDAEDARNGLAIAQANETSFFKFLSGGWRNLKSTVESSYDFAQHKVAPTITAVLTELVEYHEHVSSLEAIRAHARARYGIDDPRVALDLIDEHHSNPLFVGFVAIAPSLGPDGVQRVSTAVAQIVDLAGRLVLGPQATVGDVASIAAGLIATSAAHEQALVSWGAGAGTLAPDVLEWVVDSDQAIGPLELRLIDDAARQLLDEAGSAMRSGAEIDGLVAALLDQHTALLHANAKAVADTVRDRFLGHIAHSEASMAGRPDGDKAFKKSYNAGRRVLEREFTKKMRYRSIRELADGDTGLVVGDLRPIWLMSPLSVSDTLPLDADMFDAVVFDEASQIPVEDAIPSTFRSRQVVVVGDRMQLPPTRFFSAANDLDDEIEATDDDESVTITLDADSFLTQADQSLSSTMLTWHYRSRSESLIAYSNHAFYEGELATVPDRHHQGNERSEITVNAPDDADRTVDDLLERPLSFHRVLGGVYRSRSNLEEADYVAELVRRLLERDTGLTIGIVAFSEAQQTAIETSLSDLAAVDGVFFERLEAERNRTEGGEYLGMFVKNLENVQGDERDIIVLSVCYAPGDDGRMRMNFGPINQAGGERRLNVIFSRAKRHMAVVSTITGDQITNTHNDGAAHLANFLHYAAAESVADTERSEVILRGLQGGHGHTPPPARSAIATEIAAGMRAAGHAADVAVGRSKFTIDVAVRYGNEYRLGIVIDPSEVVDATAHFVAEAGVLETFGWSILRVTPAEWWTAPDRVLERIELRLEQNDRSQTAKLLVEKDATPGRSQRSSASDLENHRVAGRGQIDDGSGVND